MAKNFLAVLAAGLVARQGPAMAPPDSRGFGGGLGWIVREGSTGAWQRGEETHVETGLENATVDRCVSLISQDVAKLDVCLMQETADGVSVKTTSPAFSPVLAKPNHFQNRIQFFESWLQSRLTRGNVYVLKERDGRGVLRAMYVLDPLRVQPLVATDGAVYYQLQTDNLAGIGPTLTVPASEIIHDRWRTRFHPLVGLSPLWACGLAALQGVDIQRQSRRFFKNGSRPSGVLTAPAHINDETASRLKAHWQDNYTGENAGRIAVLGDGLTYTAMGMSAVDAQLIEQLKWSSETICSVFGVPAYMAGVGIEPKQNNVEALGQQYYSQCLQFHIESLELCLTEGLELPAKYCVEFDLDDLLRMDTATQIETLTNAVKGGLMKPNEARARINLGKVKGGDAVYLQQQNYSIAALAARDAAGPPPHNLATQAPAAAPAAPADPLPPANDAQAAKSLADALIARFQEA